MPLVKWGAYDPKQAAAERDASASQSDFMKLTEGRNVIRILPPKAGENSPFKIVRQHFIKLPGGKTPAVFVCPRVHGGGRCPACEQAVKLRATGHKIDKDKAWEMSPKLRVFANVIDRKDEAAGPKVVGFGKTIFDELTALRQDEDAGGDYCHPTEGFDIIIERTGTGKNDTEYATRLARTSTPITSDAKKMSDWYDSMSNLNAQVTLKSYEDILEDLGIEPTSSAGRGRGAGRGGRTIDTDAEVVEDDDVPF